MICPKCGYEHNAQRDEEYLLVKGSEGDFYELPIMMSRPENHRYYKEEVALYGCPQCKNVFLDC